MRLQIQALTKSYRQKAALDNISLIIENGIFGLLGRNGAGKTTLMQILSTLRKPTAALIGLPMFIPLLKPEQEVGMDAIITLRPFSYRIIVVLRMALSLMGTSALIFSFEGYMSLGGCSFPAYVYTFRTLAAAITLGFIGLLASTVSGNTMVGFLVSFCWYCILQIENIGAIFKSVSNGISVCQVLLVLGSGMAIIFFSGLHLESTVLLRVKSCRRSTVARTAASPSLHAQIALVDHDKAQRAFDDTPDPE